MSRQVAQVGLGHAPVASAPVPAVLIFFPSPLSAYFGALRVRYPSRSVGLSDI